jgi:PAS domain S-box-containing protein
MFHSIEASARTLEPWRHEYRVVLPKAGLRWHLGNSRPERQQDGSILWHGLTTDITARKQLEEVQLFLMHRGAEGAAGSFFEVLAEYLAKTLGMDYVCIDRLEGEGHLARTVAIWNDGRFDPNVTYALKDTPCGDVLGKHICLFKAGVRQLFPRDAALQDLAAESYVGTTLWSSEGLPIGLIAVISRRPLPDAAQAEAILQLVAIKAAGEMERQEAESELQESEAKYRDMVETSHDLIWKCDAEGRFSYLNPAWERTHGYRLDEMLGHAFSEFQDPEVFARDSREFARHLAGGGVVGYETTHRARDGHEINLVFNARPLTDAAGTIIGAQGTAFDVTESRKAERERLELTAQLNQSQKLESLGSLAGGVAHDINNVLAAILTLASGHRERLESSDPLAQSLDTITNACVRGRDVVKSLLFFARKELVAMGPVHLNAIAREMVQLLSYTTLKRIRIHTRLEEGLPAIDGDAGALGHALMNLCVNARDAMPDGGEMTISTCLLPTGELQLMVRDTGHGMSQETRTKAIEPFFTTKPMGKGTGLGLAMVFGTMKAHKGTLELRSVPGQGTDAILTFPAVGRSTPDGVAVPGPAAPALTPRALRLLVVDDDELILLSVAPMLKLLGHEVHTAQSGLEAVARFEAGLEVDLVILDMNMPELNGSQTLIRLLALRPGQKVVMASGYSDQDIAPLLETYPNVTSIQKPFSLDEIRWKLQDS